MTDPAYSTSGAGVVHAWGAACKFLIRSLDCSCMIVEHSIFPGASSVAVGSHG
jgi:hypothetical protein